jgi:hypothetical protein
MFLQRFAIPLSLSLALVGCSKQADPAAAPSDTSGDGPEVVVLDAGAEPREPLRLTVDEGARATSTMTMAFDIAMTIGGHEQQSQAMPPMVSTISTHVTDVSDGRITFEMTYDSFSVQDGPEYAPQVVQAMEDAVEGISGMGGTFVMDDRGAMLEGEVDVPDDVDPTVRQMLEQLSTQTEQLTVPFPVEPVGEGARWVVSTELTVGEITTNLTMNYTLSSLEGEEYEFDVATEQTAEPQDATVPGMPPDASAKILDYELDGEGTFTGQTSMLLPSATTTAGGTVRMEVTSEGDTAEMVQDMEIDVSIETVPA